ncbi:MAG: ORF6N domain-containing protein [Bacteroidales bacterium]|nr:ORF6N domain-containing protein [Bacteroidales bacterium]
MTQSIILQETQIAGKIYLIRGQRVILDADLAEFYGVHRTRNFNAFEWENRKPIGF